MGSSEHVPLRTPQASAGARLTIDLDAIRANYRQLRSLAAPATCAAVMKADAYGLGGDFVAPALAREGCRSFFTAHFDEGVRLRPLLPADATIYVLHGPPSGVTQEFVRHRLVPVLNDPAQIADWRGAARSLGRVLPAAIQFDTGMSRMGLAPADLEALFDDPDALAGIAPVLAMSHLACADEPDHPMNALQHARFDARLRALRRRCPGIAASLANSSGIFLGGGFHHDLVRPGAALYGINPQPGGVNPLRQAVSLSVPIIQTRGIAAGDCVGYGARHTAAGPCRIATIALGYADGWPRVLSGRGSAFIDGRRVPFVGNVSMDSITLDVTGIPDERVAPGRLVDLICAGQTVDDIAAEAGTIGYELLTRLGRRFQRSYPGG